jgi:hypothetical protein
MASTETSRGLGCQLCCEFGRLSDWPFLEPSVQKGSMENIATTRGVYDIGDWKRWLMECRLIFRPDMTARDSVRDHQQ